MTKRRLLLVGGWAHTADDLGPLADRLKCQCEVDVIPADQAMRAGGLVSRLPQQGSFVLVGWSLGGMLALETSIGQSAVSALCLISSTPRFCEAEDWPHGAPAEPLDEMRAGLKQRPNETLLRFYRQSALPNRVDRQAARSRAEAILSGDSENLAEGLRYLASTDLRAALSRVRVPTLVVHGQQDHIIACEAGEALAQKIDQTLGKSSICIRPNAGHDLPMRHADWLANLILDFLNRHADF